MKKRIFQSNRIVFLSIVGLILILGLSACQVRQKGRKPSPDWSRSVPIGVFVRGNIDMAVRPDGEQVHLVWLKEEEEQHVVHYVQMDQTADIQVDRNLSLPADQLRNPHLELADDSNLHLLWLSRDDGERMWDLWYSQMNQNGDLIGQPLEMAPATDDVNTFVMQPDGQDGIFIAWEAEADGAIYGAHLDAGGNFIQERTLLVENGRVPALATNENQLYMTWLQENEVYFGQIGTNDLKLEGQAVTTLALSDGKALDGPILGLSDDWAYVIWGIFNIRGLEAGTGTVEYLAFPADAPIVENGQWLKIAPDEAQPYAPYESAYQISQLAPPSDITNSTDVVREPFATLPRGSELAVAASINQDFRLDRITQVGLLLFKEGAFTGYQMAGKTEAFSQEPVLGTDDEGNLHIAWREGGQGSLAYYAVTEPEARANLDRMGVNDVANVALNGGIEVVTGILFFPLACVWLFPGLFLIGIWHYWRGESDMDQPATIVVLVISIIVSLVMKFLFLPTITTYVPFSAWMDVSSRWETILRFLVPVITMAIGLLVAWRLHKRTPSAMAFFFWFIATDAVLTLAIYGVTFLGVF